MASGDLVTKSIEREAEGNELEAGRLCQGPCSLSGCISGPQGQGTSRDSHRAPSKGQGGHGSYRDRDRDGGEAGALSWPSPLLTACLISLQFSLLRAESLTITWNLQVPHW